MLKLERIGTREQVQIGIREKSSFFDSTLVRALLFSACVHLFFISAFRIKMFDFQESIPMRPISVAIDPEVSDAPQAIVDVGHEVKSYFFAHDLESSQWQESSLNQALAHSLEVSDEEIAASSTPLTYKVRSYPLKLKLSRNLKSLKILDDGSSLFKEQTSVTAPPSKKNHYIIEYQVEVDRKSGTLIHLSRTKELIDKRLQEVADQIIRRISFAKGKDINVKGTITLDFFYNGEEIQEFLGTND